MSVRSRNLRLTAIHSFFRYAAFELPTHSAQIQRVLAIPSKRFNRTLVRFHTRPEVDALLAAPARHTWFGRRDHAFILMAVQTGLRLSEITGVNRDDLVLGAGAHVRVIGKGRKERCTAAAKPTADLLNTWLREPQRGDSGLLFPNAKGERLSVGDAALLTAFVRDLVRIGPSTLSPAAAAAVGEQIIDLTAIVLGDRTGTMPRLGAAARIGTLKLRAFVESQLTNPDADAQSIAAGVGASESHANRLLALEGTSIHHLLIERRLNKCREMIEDPRHVHRSIGDIAFFYGFRDLSHFARVFKGHFGLSPSEHRRAQWRIEFSAKG